MPRTLRKEHAANPTTMKDTSFAERLDALLADGLLTPTIRALLSESTAGIQQKPYGFLMVFGRKALYCSLCIHLRTAIGAVQWTIRKTSGALVRRRGGS